MNKQKIISKIKENKSELKMFSVKKIGLFGSHAKGKAKFSSDIDILIKFDKKTFENYMKVLFLLKNSLKKNIDLVIEEDLKPELKYVKKEAEYVRI